MATLDTVIINPTTPAKTAVIWNHGLGADGHDFVNIVPELKLPETTAIRFIFPHAPMRPVTINNGFVMRAWYDIAAISRGIKEDEVGIRASENLINQLIEQQHTAGIPYERIVLAGFSQGGAMALHCGLRFPHKLAGMLALSAYLPIAETVAKEANQANKATPIMMAHGTLDPIIPLAFAEMSKNLLQQLGHPVEWHTYPMEHSVCLPEIKAISQWLIKVGG